MNTLLLKVFVNIILRFIVYLRFKRHVCTRKRIWRGGFFDAKFTCLGCYSCYGRLNFIVAADCDVWWTYHHCFPLWLDTWWSLKFNLLFADLHLSLERSSTSMCFLKVIDCNDRLDVFRLNWLRNLWELCCACKSGSWTVGQWLALRGTLISNRVVIYHSEWLFLMKFLDHIELI